MKDVAFFVGLVFGCIFCYLLFSLGVVDRVDGIPGTEQEPVFAIPTYLSFVSVMLTTVTVVLAAVAIGIGVVAAYTVREINDRADSIVKSAHEATEAAAEAAKLAAENLVRQTLERELSEDAINARINKATFRKQNPTVEELEEKFDPEDDGDR